MSQVKGKMIVVPWLPRAPMELTAAWTGNFLSVGSTGMLGFYWVIEGLHGYQGLPT